MRTLFKKRFFRWALFRTKEIGNKIVCTRTVVAHSLLRAGRLEQFPILEYMQGFVSSIRIQEQNGLISDESFKINSIQTIEVGSHSKVTL